MQGLIIVGGINSVGKGTGIRIMEHGFNSIGFTTNTLSLSRIMRDISGLNYQGISMMPIDERNFLRKEALRKVIEISRLKITILDVHFVYEDGEVPDYSIMKDSISTIISIRAQPGKIYGSLSRSAKNDTDHPGRSLLRHKGLEYIKEYQYRDTEVTKNFLRTLRPNVISIEIWNDMTHLDKFATKIFTAFPDIISSMKDQQHVSSEGQPLRFKESR